MVEIDFYYPYWLATEVRSLHEPNVSYLRMASAKAVLSDFVTRTRPEFLTRTKEKAREIVTILDPLVSAIQSGASVSMTPEEWGHLLHEIEEFERDLQKESGRLYITCVENQRLLTPYVLIEKIETAVAPKTWQYMSRMARREMEESGRCLAFERHTASGFHILRCVEIIVREYVLAVTGSLPVRRDLGHYIETLKQNGAAEEVTDILNNVRRNDRNPLMHPEDFLRMDDAISLFNLCLTALDRLIGDMEKRGFAKAFVP